MSDAAGRFKQHDDVLGHIAERPVLWECFCAPRAPRATELPCVFGYTEECFGHAGHPPRRLRLLPLTYSVGVSLPWVLRSEHAKPHKVGINVKRYVKWGLSLLRAVRGSVLKEEDRERPLRVNVWGSTQAESHTVSQQDDSVVADLGLG